MKELIEELDDLENLSPDIDDAAYPIITIVGQLAAEMQKARDAGMDDNGNDALDAFECVAQAIRDAVVESIVDHPSAGQGIRERR